MTACQYPAVVPTRDNPSGDCRREAEQAIRLGDTGRHLALCSGHAARYGSRTVPLAELEDA